MTDKDTIKDIIQKMAEESITCGWAEQETGAFEDLDHQFKGFIKEHPEYAKLDKMINPIMQYGWNIGLNKKGPFHRTGGERWGTDKETEALTLHQAEEMDKVFEYIDSI